MRNKITPLAERFAKYVDRTDPSGCWLWTGATAHGYGRIGRGGRGNGAVGAHRVAYELAHGAIPPGLFVCHRCDVRACVNPDHLFLGTALENNRDCSAKGRHWSQTTPEVALRGEKNGRARVTEAQVRAIRARYAAGGITQEALAAEHGLVQTAINKIVQRVSWKHVRAEAA